MKHPRGVAVETRRGSSVNDATVYNILESLKAAMLVDEREKIYRVNDPMLRTLLLTSQLKGHTSTEAMTYL